MKIALIFYRMYIVYVRFESELFWRRKTHPPDWLSVDKCRRICPGISPYGLLNQKMEQRGFDDLRALCRGLSNAIAHRTITLSLVGHVHQIHKFHFGMDPPYENLTPFMQAVRRSPHQDSWEIYSYLTKLVLITLFIRCNMFVQLKGEKIYRRHFFTIVHSGKKVTKQCGK